MSASPPRLVHCIRALSYALLAVALAMLVSPSANATTAVAVPTPQTAQCQPSWIPTFGGAPGLDGQVNAAIEFNDGSGPALYVAGGFTHAGGDVALFAAKWNGSSWTALPGLSNVAYALIVFDDGNGPALYIGGTFGVARWTGATWSYLASSWGGTVFALAVFDDGQGKQLYAGGAFPTANGFAANGIAKWNGSTWSPVGFGQPVGLTGVPSSRVLALAVFDDGNGDALFVGGKFTWAGATPNHNYISKWNGAAWIALGSGMNDHVSSLAVFDDGSGPALYAGGNFTNAGGVAADHLAKWDASGWSALAGGPNGDVFVLRGFNDGSGRALYAGGQFTSAAGIAASNLAKWNGSTWSAVGTGLESRVYALAALHNGGSPVLYVGGAFAHAGGLVAIGIAIWNGSEWSALGSGVDNLVAALAVFDDGTGPALFAGGWFTTAGGVAKNHVAKWNGSIWSALGSGIFGAPPPSNPVVNALAVFDDGSGPALYAGGYFTMAGTATVNNIAKWNGSVWSALGSGVGGSSSPSVATLTVFDDGTGAALYAGGDFVTAGGVTVNKIAKWNGSAWSALGTGMVGGATIALTVFDDGQGPALYAGGNFATAGAANAKSIAKWNGSTWSALGGTLSGLYNPVVRSLAVFNDGSGPALYVGGWFASAGTVTVNNIAKWNGSVWSALGSGLDNPGGWWPHALAMTVFDEGLGPKLIVAGAFTSAGGVAANNIARWDGIAWSPLDHGVNYAFAQNSLAVFDDSSGPALYVGGAFISAPDSGDSYLAKWGCAFIDSGVTYCTSGTTSGGCVPTISSTGTASATTGSGFTLSINNLESHRLGVIFYGVHGQLASPWGAGGASLLCVKSPTQRLDPYDSGGSPGLCNGLISEDWNLFIATHASALGQPFLGGETVWAQGWFRDPPSAKTTALSNGLVFAVAP